MKVLLVLAALVLLAYGQTTESPDPLDACLEEFTTNPANSAALFAVGTNCADIFNNNMVWTVQWIDGMPLLVFYIQTDEDQAFETAACNTDRNGACFTSLNVLIQACNVDVDACK